MVIAVRTEELAGDLVVVKEARTDGDVARLTREATMLTRGRHPGVVELVDVDDHAIRLRHAGTPLARLGPFPLDEAAAIVSAVADVVDALHRQGVVHGDLDPRHVVIDQRGRPRLCGFGRATERTDAGAADDVAALGRLLVTLLERAEGLPWARPPTGLRSRSRRRQARRELEALASRARGADLATRPSARQLAKAIHVAVPELRLPAPKTTPPSRHRSFAEIPSDVDPTADLAWTDDDLSFLAADPAPDDVELEESAGQRANAATRRSSVALAEEPPAPDEAPSIPLPETPPASRVQSTGASLPWRGVLLALVLVCGVLAGAIGARAIAPFGDEAAPTEATAPDTSSTVAAASPTTPASAPSATQPAWPTRCRIPEPTGPDVDGDGCPDAVQLDGRTATLRTVTVTLGEDGDVVTLGDWDCDGVATPALLRPATGEVFVFLAWSLDEPVEVTASTVVSGASDIATGPGACPAPVVQTPEGPLTVAVTR